MFQTHFVTEVLNLTNGFDLKVPNRRLSCKLRIQGQVADLPAKAASLNMKQYNGKFGCSICLEPGEKDGDNPLLRHYPYKATKAPLRNHEDTMQHADLASSKSSIFSVKGSSPVHEILKIPEKVLLDFMHQVLEGELYRRLKSFFFLSSNEAPFCLKECIHAIDTSITAVKLPHDFPKKMRTISELGKWKAHEKGMFLFHMSLPCLRRYLPAEHFFHHSLFVTGMRILTEDSLVEEDITLAELMLDSYVRLVEELYGKKERTYNLHSISHFAQQTRNHGNPILQSAFVFEGMIALLKKKFHGTRGIISQMIRNMATSQTYQSEILRNVTDPPQAKNFCKNVLQLNEKNVMMSETIYFYKPLQKTVPLVQNLDSDTLNLICDNEEVLFSSRITKEGEVFHSESYSYRRSSCSFFVSFFYTQEERTVNYGKIQCFLKNSRGLFAIIKVAKNLQKNICQTDELPNPEDPVMRQFHTEGLLGSHFVAIGDCEIFKIISCDNILSRVVFFPLEDADPEVKGFVSTVLKTYQHN